MSELQRSTRKTVVFAYPFVLDTADGPLPAGSYDVETEEELIPNLSFIAYRRVRTTLTSPATARGMATQHQVLTIDPAALKAALAGDEARSLRDAASKPRLQPEDHAPMSPNRTPETAPRAGPKSGWTTAPVAQLQKHNLISSAPVLVPILIVLGLVFITWYRPPPPHGGQVEQLPRAAAPAPAR